MEETTPFAFSFPDFPEDVQCCILSFLQPLDLSIFACTSKRYVSLCRDDQRLWFSMCDRRWGSKTHINKWVNNTVISYKHLYNTLHNYENLIGFWRRSSTPSPWPPPSPPPQTTATISPNLIVIEWGPFYLTGFRVSSSEKGTYKVKKIPFLLMGFNSKGQPVNYLDPEGCIEFLGDSIDNWEDLKGLEKYSESSLIPVTVNSIGSTHIVVDEIWGLMRSSNYSPENDGKKMMSRVGSTNSWRDEEDEEIYRSPGEKGDWSMQEIYHRFANLSSPGGNGASRRQRRREREKLGKKKWESEHYVKIVNHSPTLDKPLQGLWKGICGDMSLEFYLVAYDEIGGITCRRIVDTSELLSFGNQIFWTSNTMFIESPFPCEEKDMYDTRFHVEPLTEATSSSENKQVSRMLCVTANYTLDVPDFGLIPQHGEGRIWQYGNGTFGFGILEFNYIIDFKHIAQDGFLLDTV